MLHPEFSNPLFLKLFCEGLKRAGLFRIPKGHTGITRIIEFFLKHVNKKLSRPSEFHHPDGINIVRKVIDKLIEAKLQNNGGFIYPMRKHTLLRITSYRSSVRKKVSLRL